VIPTWNQAALLDKTLGTLQRQSVRASEIIVVDNGSADNSIAVAKSYGASIIALGSNYGFAKAVNTGIEAARSEWIFVLNNDVELDARWLECALLAADSQQVLLVVGKVLQSSQPDRIDGTWDLVSLSGCAWRCGWQAVDGPLWNEREPAPIVSFTACLIHRRVFETVGLLDVSYGSYYEDVDFGLRCALAGFTAIFEPAARALHLGSATLGSGRKTAYLISRNQVLLASKFGLAKLSPLRVVLGQFLFVLTRFRRRGFMAAVRGKWDGIRLARSLPRDVADASQVRSLLSEQEKQIVYFQRQLGWDLSWKIYFFVLGCG
jgi:hypothetical protein